MMSILGSVLLIGLACAVLFNLWSIVSLQRRVESLWDMVKDLQQRRGH